MPSQTIRNILTLLAITFLFATVSDAQSSTSTEVPVAKAEDNWQNAQSFANRIHKLYVVTIDQPNRRQACHIQSFTVEKLVCSRAIGGSRTYLPLQVLALIRPGEHALYWWLGFNGGLGVSIWATVMLVPVCPVCAAGTALAALFFFDAAGLTAFTGGEPDLVFYLAPGQHLTGKFATLSVSHS